MSKEYLHNQPKTKEQFYYRELFEKYYGGHSNVIPYFWMPRSEVLQMPPQGIRYLLIFSCIKYFYQI